MDTNNNTVDFAGRTRISTQPAPRLRPITRTPRSYWVGSTNGDWNNPANWSGGTIPSPGTTWNTGDDVVLDSSTQAGDYVVTISDEGRACRTLNITPGAGRKITLRLDTTRMPILVIKGDDTTARRSGW